MFKECFTLALASCCVNLILADVYFDRSLILHVGQIFALLWGIAFIELKRYTTELSYALRWNHCSAKCQQINVQSNLEANSRENFAFATTGTGRPILNFVTEKWIISWMFYSSFFCWKMSRFIFATLPLELHGELAKLHDIIQARLYRLTKRYSARRLPKSFDKHTTAAAKVASCKEDSRIIFAGNKLVTHPNKIEHKNNNIW